jgi:hypothetical protein
MTAPSLPVAPIPAPVVVPQVLAANPPASLQDIVTAVLAFAISLLTLVLFIVCFHSASTATAAVFASQKEILNLSLTTFGVVVGYYFGRAPADRQAQQANQAASQIQIQLNQQQQQTIDATVHSRTSLMAAQQAQQQSNAIKNEVAKEIAALAQPLDGTTPIAGSSSTQSLTSASLTHADLQKRMADLLERVNQIG